MHPCERDPFEAFMLSGRRRAPSKPSYRAGGPQACPFEAVMLSGRPQAWCGKARKRNTPQCARDESESDKMLSKSCSDQPHPSAIVRHLLSECPLLKEREFSHQAQVIERWKE